MCEKMPRRGECHKTNSCLPKDCEDIVRHIMTEALLLLGKREANPNNLDDITETVDRLSRLVERLEGRLEIIQPNQTAKPDLSTSFISSIKMAVKPGMRINDG